MTGPALTSLSKGSGCGCKINPAALSELLEGFTTPEDVPGLVAGNSMAEDCSVFDLGGGQYLLQTVDFFTPIVNDAYVFGAASAANALSDIWAMGGRPLMANAVFSWPLEKLPLSLGREVLRGAADICKKAGVPLAGGHSIDGQEPLFGLSVTGLCAESRLKRNAGARAGDSIILSRPLGVGMLAAAHKRGVATDGQEQALFEALQQLNAAGESLSSLDEVHAMTDVTGFGLAGHLLEMCRGAGLGAEINFSALPLIAEARALAESFVLPDNAMRNWNAYEKEVRLDNPTAFPWLVDPQTNGGLLVAVHPDAVERALQIIGPGAAVIGTFTEGEVGIAIN